MTFHELLITLLLRACNGVCDCVSKIDKDPHAFRITNKPILMLRLLGLVDNESANLDPELVETKLREISKEQLTKNYKNVNRQLRFCQLAFAKNDRSGLVWRYDGLDMTSELNIALLPYIRKTAANNSTKKRARSDESFSDESDSVSATAKRPRGGKKVRKTDSPAPPPPIEEHHNDMAVPEIGEDNINDADVFLNQIEQMYEDNNIQYGYEGEEREEERPWDVQMQAYLDETDLMFEQHGF
eukprot:comp14137_c0_seq1/m.20138 comp14137_c0_seq1/g.20138  ORF comp14137_c0_seq1/g.20138 comp14137_c0_seq1/m.20138 type:complete len:242 (-) comp14137_c0_seq1:41-766(-)